MYLADECKITVLSENKNPIQKTLLESAKKSDLTIKVEDHIFLGHKEILATRNSVFETVISALPKNSGLSSSVSIPDFDSRVFKIFLKYIYTQYIDENDISKELINAAHKYVDLKLKKICEDHLVSTVSENTAVRLLILGANTCSENLKEVASKFIADRFAQMKQRADFQEVTRNPEAIKTIFKQFELQIGSYYDSLHVQKSTLYLNCFSSLFRVFILPLYIIKQFQIF